MRPLRNGAQSIQAPRGIEDTEANKKWSTITEANEKWSTEHRGSTRNRGHGGHENKKNNKRSTVRSSSRLHTIRISGHGGQYPNRAQETHLIQPV